MKAITKRLYKTTRVLLPAVLLTVAVVPGGFAAERARPRNSAVSVPAGVAAHYRFELVGPTKSAGGGKNIVWVRLMRDGKPVTGAIIMQSRAEMSPLAMAAPVMSIPSTTPDVFVFEISNGSVWPKPDNWALTLAAKVQGEAQTVRGTVIVELKP